MPNASRRANFSRRIALRDDFEAEVFAVVAQIPAGRVATYGDIARLVGMPGYARHVGNALAKAPEGTPCHRVVNAAGRTAPGWCEQRALLRSEGVELKRSGMVDLRRFRWELLG